MCNLTYIMSNRHKKIESLYINEMNSESKIPCNVKCGIWKCGILYLIGDIVRHDEGIWIATNISVDIRPKEDCSKYWFLIYKEKKHKYEVWKQLTHYIIGDIVRYNNKSWVAIKPSFDKQPSDNSCYWFWISEDRPEIIGNWSSTTNYDVGDIVVYNNMTYANISPSLNNIPSSSPTNWFLICGDTVGRKEIIGLWNSTINYDVGDITVYNNMTWACISPSLNNIPPSSPLNWFLICGNTSGGGGGGGGGNRNVLTLLNRTTDYNVTPIDQVVQIENTQNINAFLPIAATNSGQIILIAKISNNPDMITVQTQSGDLIDGTYPSIVLNEPYGKISLISNGINAYFII